MIVARERTRSRPATGVTGELAKVVGDVTEAYGGHVMHMASQKPAFKHTPTGIFTLDMALFGGVPEGLCTLLYGRESSGKTTLATRCVANSQRKYPNKRPVFIDIEGTFDPVWAARHGVDNERLVLVQPSTGEMALDIADGVLRAEETSIVVVDSLAALTPFKELERSLEDELVGRQALLIGRFVRKVQNAFLDERKRNHWPTVIMLNQWRTNIGMFKGDPRVLPGGKAQHYVASVKVEVTNKEHMGRDDRDMETVDHNVHGFKVAKCKIGTGIRTGEFNMIRDPSNPLGQGFVDDARTVATWAKKMGLITGSGGAFRVDGVDETFRTLDAICAHFYSDLDFYDQFKHRLITEQRRACGLVAENWY